MHGLLLAVLPLLALFQAPPPDAPAPVRKPPTFTAKLLAATDSLQPGGETTLAVVINVGKGWHIYHPIMLDTGKATQLQFSGPAGVTLGEVQFPTPALANLHGIEYLELTDEVICTVPLKLDPAYVAGKPLRLRVDVSGLACIEECIPVSAAALLTLPVNVAAGQPANKDVFERAAAKFPPPLAEADHIRGSRVSLNAEKYKVHDKGVLTATIKVTPGEHIQDRDPGVEGLIGARLYIEKVDGLTFVEKADQIWPEPTIKNDPTLGKIREQRGEVQIRVPFEITDEKFPGGPAQARVLFEFQTCNDKGVCFSPQMAAGVVRLTVESSTPRADSGVYKVASDAAMAGWSDEIARGIGVVGATSTGASPTTLWSALLAAFLGGLILNIMPCVLPVISLKVLSFMQQGGESRGRVFRLGAAFCSGIMVWFWIFAWLSTRGQFQLQNPTVVIAMSTVLFLMALSLFGVFEFTLPGAAAGSLESVAMREGYSGAFLKGFLATLLGTACTAPFLGAGLAFASTQTPLIAFAVFSAAGLGMSAPYLLLAANPAWLKFVPKPGMWMVTFKQAMGFLLVGTSVWLLWVLGSQLGVNGVIVTIVFWTFLSFGAWQWGLIKPTWTTRGKTLATLTALAMATCGYFVSFNYFWAPETARIETRDPNEIVQLVRQKGWNNGIPWAPYTKGLADDLARLGYTVYVDYTATWCANCQINKRVALEIDSTRELMHSLNVIPLEADYSKYDAGLQEDILRLGQKYERNSVPLNIIYPAGKPAEPIVLPVLLSPGTVQDALKQAGASTAASTQVVQSN